ncbi:MAG TPA: hypothetical protein VFI95_06140 [Terriglobales bacterium]|nr:hypothetical protein [Terriglobales bacterium]
MNAAGETQGPSTLQNCRERPFCSARDDRLVVNQVSLRDLATGAGLKRSLLKPTYAVLKDHSSRANLYMCDLSAAYQSRSVSKRLAI